MNHIYAEKQHNFFLGIAFIFIFVFLLSSIQCALHPDTTLYISISIFSYIIAMIFYCKSYIFSQYIEIDRSQYLDLYLLGIENEQIKLDIKNIMNDSHIINVHEYKKLKKLNKKTIDIKILIVKSFL